MTRGSIRLLVPRKGHGYIDGPFGEVYFDWSVLEGMSSNELTAGMTVMYESVPGPTGARAVSVRPLRSTQAASVEPGLSDRLRDLRLTRMRAGKWK